MLGNWGPRGWAGQVGVNGSVPVLQSNVSTDLRLVPYPHFPARRPGKPGVKGEHRTPVRLAVG